MVVLDQMCQADSGACAGGSILVSSLSRKGCSNNRLTPSVSCSECLSVLVMPLLGKLLARR